MRFPAEWEKHERTWVAFPHAGYTLGDTEQEQLAARQTWANVANAASEFEKVSCVVNPGDIKNAKKFLSSEIELVEIAIDDAWIRDSGPSFVIDKDELKAVNWVFNGWGAQDWARFEKDAKLATAVANHLEVETIGSRLTNEGGGFHVDGNGTVMLDQGTDGCLDAIGSCRAINPGGHVVFTGIDELEPLGAVCSYPPAPPPARPRRLRTARTAC